MIKWLRYKHRIQAPQPPQGSLNLRQVCQSYGVSLWVVHYGINRDIIPAVQRKPNRPYAIMIDSALDHRLRKWLETSAHLHPSSQTQAV
jgi:hypothetical protein